MKPDLIEAIGKGGERRFQGGCCRCRVVEGILKVCQHGGETGNLNELTDGHSDEVEVGRADGHNFRNRKAGEE